jgi:hypothetical protein
VEAAPPGRPIGTPPNHASSFARTGSLPPPPPPPPIDAPCTPGLRHSDPTHASQASKGLTLPAAAAAAAARGGGVLQRVLGGGCGCAAGRGGEDEVVGAHHLASIHGCGAAGPQLGAHRHPCQLLPPRGQPHAPQLILDRSGRAAQAQFPVTAREPPTACMPQSVDTSDAIEFSCRRSALICRGDRHRSLIPHPEKRGMEGRGGEGGGGS